MYAIRSYYAINVSGGCPAHRSAFGYTNYSRAGYRPHLVTFTDIAGVGTNGAVGAVLGGTGISISSQTAHADIAYDFSFWLASGAVQSGFYCEFDGQPAHASAWDSAENNRNNFV